MVHEAIGDDPAGEDLLRLAAQHEDEVIVVYVQIDAPATQLAEVLDVAGPFRGRDYATKVGGQQPPVFAPFNTLAGEAKFGKEGKHMGDQQRDTDLLAAFTTRSAALRSNRDRLFDKSRLARRD